MKYDFVDLFFFLKNVLVFYYEHNGALTRDGNGLGSGDSLKTGVLFVL